ncbi:MAG: sulfite exporter TauE/SafE family protein, partial [Gemmatimonadaceae bacterium]
MIATAVGILTASMLGSIHCAGMCGPFVCFYAGGPAKPVQLRSHAWYNLGRLLSYLLLGATAG